MGLYKIRANKIGKNKTSSVYAVAVPSHVARMIPEGARFAVELTDDGILYRFVTISDETPAAEQLPAWLQNAELV